MKQFVAAGTALVLAPALVAIGVAVIGSGVANEAAASAAAAAACTYGNPDPDRIAVAMEQLGSPVDEASYTTHAAAAGITTPHSASTAAQRRQVLVTALRSSLWTVEPRTVTTPVLRWWGAPLPADDLDTRWEDTTVPGYGRLGDYMTEFLDVYAVDPAVLATVTHVDCTPRTTGRCLPPDDLEPILETIRALESGGDYTARAAGSSASGAYQFIDGTWNKFGGYRRAHLAPPNVQDAKAREMIVTVLEAHGNDVAAIPVVWYLGHLPRPDSNSWDTIPAPEAGNVLTPREYQTRWVSRFLDIAGGDADTCPTPTAFTTLEGPDCDGLKGTGATYNGMVNGALSVSDLEATPWGPLQPAAAQGWRDLVEAGTADGFPRSTFNAWSGGPGSRNGGSSNHTIGLAIDINALAWTPTRRVPGERLPVAFVFDEALYQWLRNNAWRFGWCNPRWARPYYLNGTSEGGKDAAGNGNHLEPWHFEFVGGSDHYSPARSGDLNGPHGVAD
jgi:hypothetical protein